MIISAPELDSHLGAVVQFTAGVCFPVDGVFVTDQRLINVFDLDEVSGYFVITYLYFAFSGIVETQRIISALVILMEFKLSAVSVYFGVCIIDGRGFFHYPEAEVLFVFDFCRGDFPVIQSVIAECFCIAQNYRIVAGGVGVFRLVSDVCRGGGDIVGRIETAIDGGAPAVERGNRL